MRFGRLAAGEAEGAILAHGVAAGGMSFRKGRVLSAADIAALTAAGIAEVMAARLDPGDVPEDEAAAALAAVLARAGVTVSAPFTGRCNLYAEAPGVLRLDPAIVHAINAVHESITLATLPAFDAVAAKAMLATIKIIPFAAPRDALAGTVRIARESAGLSVARFKPKRVGLVSTSLPQTKATIHTKNRTTLEERLRAASATIVHEAVVPHHEAGVASGLAACFAAGAEMAMIYGASAITDRRDVVPAGIEAAGGAVQWFGMPVDPGNLLLLAEVSGKPVIGLPGCARSPKINGFDFVLQRLLADVPVTPRDIARMGAGGLLKEIPTRPQPRESVPEAPRQPRIAALVLAAGRSTRMGANKLLADVGGKPMVRHAVEAALASQAEAVVVVTGHEAARVRAALAGLDVRFAQNDLYADGLSTSVRAGVAAAEGADGALVCLGDMPGLTARTIDRLIAAFNPAEGRGVIVPVHDGRRGNPVLWGRAFFADLMALSGDVGAKPLLAGAADAVCEVEIGDDGVLTDLDTPDALDAWRARA